MFFLELAGQVLELEIEEKLNLFCLVWQLCDAFYAKLTVRALTQVLAQQSSFGC